MDCKTFAACSIAENFVAAKAKNHDFQMFIDQSGRGDIRGRSTRFPASGNHRVYRRKRPVPYRLPHGRAPPDPGLSAPCERRSARSMPRPRLLDAGMLAVVEKHDLAGAAGDALRFVEGGAADRQPVARGHIAIGVSRVSCAAPRTGYRESGIDHPTRRQSNPID